MNSQTFSPNLKKSSSAFLSFAFVRLDARDRACDCDHGHHLLPLPVCPGAWSRDSEWFSLGFPFSLCCPHRDLCSPLSCSLSVSQPVQYECKIAKSWCDKWWCLSLSTCWKIRWRSCKIDKQAPSSGKFSSSKWKWIVLLSSRLLILSLQYAYRSRSRSLETSPSSKWLRWHYWKFYMKQQFTIFVFFSFSPFFLLAFSFSLSLAFHSNF